MMLVSGFNPRHNISDVFVLISALVSDLGLHHDADQDPVPKPCDGILPLISLIIANIIIATRTKTKTTSGHKTLKQRHLNST